MKRDFLTTDTRSRFWLAGLHLILAFSLPLLLVIFVGCKQAKAKPEDLGPEVTSDAVNDALAKAMQDASLNRLAPGQSVRYSHTRRIENDETAVDLGERKVEVIDRVDTDTEALFTMRISDKQRLENGNYRTIVTEDPIALEKTPALAQSFRSPAGQLTAQSLSADEGEGKKGRVTFHHLNYSTATIDPPTAIKQRPDCGGLSSCQMHVRYVQFDMVLWETDTNYQKISFDFAFSLDSPFLPYGDGFEQLNGALITDCRSTFVPIQSRTVYVRDCFALEDFKF